MKINDLGQIVLTTHNEEYLLKPGANYVTVKNDVINIDKYVDKPDCSFLINIDEEHAHLIKINGEFHEICNGEALSLYDNSSFIVNSKQFKFIFKYQDEKLEDIIECFMDGNLSFLIDMESIFYKYAQRLKITDRKAISNVMAVIDIPEIDNI